MAITASYVGPGVPVTDPGQDGFERVRLTSDGTGTTVLVTLPSTAPGKRIMGYFGPGSGDIPATGVLGTTGFTLTLTGTALVIPNGAFVDLLLYCRSS